MKYYFFYSASFAQIIISKNLAAHLVTYKYYQNLFAISIVYCYKESYLSQACILNKFWW